MSGGNGFKVWPSGEVLFPELTVIGKLSEFSFVVSFHLFFIK